MQHKNREGGFVGLIILIIIGLALLKYFLNFDVFAAADSQHGQETIGYTGQIIRTIWSYISTPVGFAWNEIVVPILKLCWATFEHFISWSNQNLESPGSTDIFH